MTAHTFADAEEFLGTLRSIGDDTPAPRPNGVLAGVLDTGFAAPRAVAAASARSASARRRRRVPTKWRALVPTSLVGAVVFGGLASAGALPSGVQHATAQVAAHLGVALPDGATPAPIHAPEHPRVPAQPTEHRAHAGGATQEHTSSPTTAPRSEKPTPNTPAPASPTAPQFTAPTLPQLPTLPTPTIPKLPTLPTLPKLPAPVPTPTVPGLSP